MVKKVILLLVLLASLSACVGSPVTVQVVKDVNGDVTQEGGNSIDANRTVTQAEPMKEVESVGTGRWVAFLVWALPAMLFVAFIVYRITSSEGYEYDEQEHINYLKEEEKHNYG